MPGSIRRYFAARGGSAAVEFALIVPVFVVLTLGVMNLMALLWAQTQLNHSVDQTARYWAVSNAGTATTSTSTVLCDASCAQTYALAHYHGPLPAPTFIGTAPYDSSGNAQAYCRAASSAATAVPGYVVKATTTYTLNAVFVTWPARMAARACFPYIS